MMGCRSQVCVLVAELETETNLPVQGPPSLQILCGTPKIPLLSHTFSCVLDAWTNNSEVRKKAPLRLLNSPAISSVYVPLEHDFVLMQFKTILFSKQQNKFLEKFN